jgi:hypothetical protein
MSSAGRRGFEAFDSIHYVLEGSKWEGIDNMMSPTFPVGEAFTLTPPGGLRVPLGARSKQGFTLSSQGLSGDAAPRLLDRKITIYMFGEFYYKDAFKACHLTRFCFVIGRKSLHRNPRRDSHSPLLPQSTLAKLHR